VRREKLEKMRSPPEMDSPSAHYITYKPGGAAPRQWLARHQTTQEKIKD